MQKWVCMISAERGEGWEREKERERERERESREGEREFIGSPGHM